MAFLSEAEELDAVLLATLVRVKTVVAEHDGDENQKTELENKIKSSNELQERVLGLRRYNVEISDSGRDIDTHLGR